MNTLLRSATLLTLVSLALAARADTLYDNLGAAPFGTEAVAGSTIFANRFTTGASDYLLTSVTLRATQASGTLTLALYSNAGTPGSILGLLGTATSAGSGLLSFDGNGIALDPFTNYWVVASDPSGSAEWSWTGGNAGSGTTSNVSWAVSNVAGASWFAVATEPFMMSVTARPVPEPASMAALGLGAVAMLRRRKRA